MHPGTSGTSASAMIRFEVFLSPMARMADAGGPTKASPAAAHAAENSWFSDRKP